jgi:hypothetical protein
MCQCCRLYQDIKLTLKEVELALRLVVTWTLLEDIKSYVLIDGRPSEQAYHDAIVGNLMITQSLDKDDAMNVLLCGEYQLWAGTYPDAYHLVCVHPCNLLRQKETENTLMSLK